MKIGEIGFNVISGLIHLIILAGALLMCLPMLVACAIDDYNENKRSRR